MAKIKKRVVASKFSKDVGQLELYILLVYEKNNTIILEKFWQYIPKLNICLSYYPAIPT